MKKILKIIGYILAGLILILITSALLIRFVFKEQMIAYTSKLEEKERIELLRNATPYVSDTAHYHFVYQQDTLQAQKIRAYFRLDTLLTDSSATTWNKALALAKFGQVGGALGSILNLPIWHWVPCKTVRLLKERARSCLPGLKGCIIKI